MEDYKIIQIHAQNRVIVRHGRWSDDSTCYYKTKTITGKEHQCKRQDKYVIFTGASERLSTLYSHCCEKHLQETIERAISDSEKCIKRDIEREKKREVEKAKAILTKARK